MSAEFPSSTGTAESMEESKGNSGIASSVENVITATWAT